MISAVKINKSIRRILLPVLKENGFTSVHTRNNLAWHNECIWVLKVKPIGKSFSDVTGWSPLSLSARLGIYYPFVPPMDNKVKDRRHPKYEECQLQQDLHCTMDQSGYVMHIDRSERVRKDIWWVEPSGSNINGVITDIKHSFLNVGVPWLKKFTNVESAFAKIENKFDCYHKFHTAKYFAKYLNEWNKYEKYHQLFKIEAEKFEE